MPEQDRSASRTGTLFFPFAGRRQDKRTVQRRQFAVRRNQHSIGIAPHMSVGGTVDTVSAHPCRRASAAVDVASLGASELLQQTRLIHGAHPFRPAFPASVHRHEKEFLLVETDHRARMPRRLRMVRRQNFAVPQKNLPGTERSPDRLFTLPETERYRHPPFQSIDRTLLSARPDKHNFMRISTDGFIRPENAADMSRP